jgi:Flp pilus assembly protein TadD
LILARSGDLKNGEEELRVALKLKPNDPDVLKALSIIEGLRSKQAHLN